MKDEVILYYRYSDLDKVHEYQITNDLTIMNQWVWYYIGKYLKLNRNEKLFPYAITWDIGLKKLGTYKLNGARERARYIVNKIKKHRKLRKVKNET